MSLEATTTISIPKAFIKRRLHSLLGFWLVIYLIEHLVTNSQAALWIGEDGHGFIRMVNFLQHLPYLQVVEVVLLGIPILFHALLGIQYLFTSKSNAKTTDGSSPSLKEYGRNRAYTWQRITSWVLLLGILFHVVQMRFLNKPKEILLENQSKSLTVLSADPGLYTLCARLQVELFSKAQIVSLPKEPSLDSSKEVADPFIQSSLEEQRKKQYATWIQTMQDFSLQVGQLVALCPDVGTALLLATRDVFKSPWMAFFYTLFVGAALFHAFNGLWTFLISWGAILSVRSQAKALNVCIVLMGLLGFLGLAAIWGSYWINLRH